MLVLPRFGSLHDYSIVKAAAAQLASDGAKSCDYCALSTRHQTVMFLSLSDVAVAARNLLSQYYGALLQMSEKDVDFSILVGSEVPTRSFKAGETIFREGDPADELYVIQKGQVGVQTGNRLLDTLKSKTIFGEMALVDSAPRSADAVALTDVTLVPVSERQFLFLVSETPYFALNVMRLMARRLRATNKAL
jgi:CRP-like cAMP-binding protein